MRRFVLLASLLILAWVGRSSAQCGFYPYPIQSYPTIIYVPSYPLYGYPSSVWGAPQPKRLPPTYVPNAKVKEEDGPKPKEKELPTIPKSNLPIENEGKKVLPPPKPMDPKDDKPNASQNVDQFLIAGKESKAEPSKEVKIGFFNHSSKEIKLEINGETVTLPSEQYVTLRMPRSFSWSVKGEKGRDVTVPNDADGLEIVFRK